MIIRYSPEDFILEGDNYFSPAFKVKNTDDLIVIEVELTEDGMFSTQESFDGNN
jgi:hypothetical protein